MERRLAILIQEVIGLVYLWLLEDGANSSPIEGTRSFGSLIEGFLSMHNKIYIMNPLCPQQVREEQGKMREKMRVENERRKKRISEDKRIEAQDVIDEKSREEKVKSDKNISYQKKQSAMEVKRSSEQESFKEKQGVIDSIPASLEECECRKSVVSIKYTEGKTKESEYLIENHESLKEKQDSISILQRLNYKLWNKAKSLDES
ncbi:hypothetical protein M9H77_07898 [Catharanthus roseus]|uniref:Uncharacterized protein n=1 Tax=Catharanthus roseus TaxID=4058 RepID=A0ACC0BWN6_CATRO|nr:hypothetical protein M9H77_07898 [Catharanthus roseus]